MKSPRYAWLLILLVPFLLLTGSAAWLLASNSGLQWLLGVATSKTNGQLSTNEVSGSLLNSFGMQGLVWHDAGRRISLTDVQLNWQPAALLHGELKLLHLSASEVQVLVTSSDKPLALPNSLHLPLEVSLLHLEIKKLSVAGSDGASPGFEANNIEARLLSGKNHLQLQSLRAQLLYGNFSSSGEIALDKPYALKVKASLESSLKLGEKVEKAHLTANAKGNLNHLNINIDGVGAGVSVKATTQLTPFSTVPISSLQLAFKGMDAARLFKSAPSTSLSGNVNLQGLPGGELKGNLQARNTHTLPIDKNGLPVQAVKAQVRLSSSGLRLQQLDIRLPNNGHVVGTLFWQGQGNILDIQLKVHSLNPSIVDTRLPAGTLHGDVKLDGAGDNQQAVVALSDGTVELLAEIDRQGKDLKLPNILLKRGSSVFSGHGKMALDRRRSFRFSGKLGKLNLADFVDIPASDLSATMELSGMLLPEVEGSLQFNLSDSHYAQSSISGNGLVKFIGKRRTEAVAEINLGDNYLKLNIAHGTGADHALLELNAPKLTQFSKGLNGQLTANANLSGSFVEPRLELSVHGIDLVFPDGQGIAMLNAKADLSSAAMKLNCDLENYRNDSALNIPKANITLLGSRVKHELLASASISKDDSALGEVTLKANGGLSDPAAGWKNIQWVGELTGLTVQGVMPLRLSAATPLTISRDIFQLGEANVTINGGRIKFSNTRWTSRGWHSTGNFTGLAVRAINMQQESASLAGIEPIRFGGKWDVSKDERLQGSLFIQRESGDWVVDNSRNLRLGLSNMQLTAQVVKNQLQAKLDANGDLLGDIAVHGSVPLNQDVDGWTLLHDAPISGNVQIRTKDLSWFGPLIDNNLQSSGRLDINAKLGGSYTSPRLFGWATGKDLGLSMLDQGISLEKGELAVRFESDNVYIDSLSFLSPHLLQPSDKLLADYKLPSTVGKLNASGRINLSGSSGDLKISAEYLPLAQRADRWIIASGSGHAGYADKTMILEGDIRADAGLINQPSNNRPRFSDDVEIIGQEAASRSGPKNRVNANLDLGDHFYIRASGFEGRLAGQLKVSGEPAKPLRVTGIIAAQDSVFDAYGQHLQVERGMVNFQGPFADPGLNILALRKGLTVEAGVEVTGTVRRPKVRLVSTPNVPDAEKLSWIILGRVPEGDGVDSALLLAAAGNILGSQPSGQLAKALGVDELSLSQQTGADAQQSQKVTVGKRLSKRTRISYEHDLNEVGGITKLTYTLTPRITIVTRTGSEDAMDIFYSFHFY